MTLKTFKVTSFSPQISPTKGGGEKPLWVLSGSCFPTKIPLMLAAVYSLPVSLPFFPPSLQIPKSICRVQGVAISSLFTHLYRFLSPFPFTASTPFWHLFYIATILTPSSPAKPDSGNAVPATKTLLLLGSWRANDGKCSKSFFVSLFDSYLCLFISVTSKRPVSWKCLPVKNLWE